MKRRNFIRSSSLIGMAAFLPDSMYSKNLTSQSNLAGSKIFITGGSADAKMMNFFLNLTGKENPKVCLLPTASADNPYAILWWYERANDLGFRPYVQQMFISSYQQKESFESVLLDMDAIWVSGGNTLNMIAIWRVQGIDKILREAWEKGIVLGGGSAGSICWFEGGVTDSRPIELTAMEALGFLKGSHCPHYDSEGPRQGAYHSMLVDGRLQPGYALDDNIGLLFEGTELKKVVSSKAGSKGYYASLVDGKVVERELEAALLDD
jgi:dipeptidase E